MFRYSQRIVGASIACIFRNFRFLGLHFSRLSCYSVAASLKYPENQSSFVDEAVSATAAPAQSLKRSILPYLLL